jgi:mono/diheme cytochrome c family protein
MIEALYRFLKSVGYEHPIHSPIVHMPIGLITGAFVFFVIALLFKRKQLILSARHASILALAFAFPTILFGVFDWIHFYHGAMIPAIKYKMVLAGLVLVLLGLGIILGSEVKIRSTAMVLVYTFTFLAAVGLGYFGGNLVYGQGPAVDSSQLGVSQAGPTAAGSPAASAGDGRALFGVNCAACHPGGANVIVASLPIRGSKRLSDIDAFEKFLRAPTMPDGKEGSMPAFADETLNRSQIKSIYDYVSANFRK